MAAALAACDLSTDGDLYIPDGGDASLDDDAAVPEASTHDATLDAPDDDATARDAGGDARTSPDAGHDASIDAADGSTDAAIDASTEDARDADDGARDDGSDAGPMNDASDAGGADDADADDGSALADAAVDAGSSDAADGASPSCVTAFTVVNSGASAYVINGVSNPALTVCKGTTVTFAITSPGHPFVIKTEQSTGTTGEYDDGITNNGTTSGNLVWIVSASATAQLFYNCEIHPSMTGAIQIR